MIPKALLCREDASGHDDSECERIAIASNDQIRFSNLLRNLNLYPYVGNDPMDKPDPMGLATSCDIAEPCGAAVVTAVGVGVGGVAAAAAQ